MKEGARFLLTLQVPLCIAVNCVKILTKHRIVVPTLIAKRQEIYLNIITTQIILKENSVNIIKQNIFVGLEPSALGITIFPKLISGLIIGPL